jgi:GWxTD domain-containing protein
MRRRLPISLFCLSLALSAAAATLPELFMKAKEQFKLGNYKEALITIETLDAESGKPGLEAERQKILPGLLFYKAASLAALGHGEEAEQVFESFLARQPNAALDPAMYPPKVIAAFENARKSTSVPPRAEPAPGGTLAAAFGAFHLPESKPLEEAGDEWALGPAKYILTASERQDFQRLSDPLSRSEFIAVFWKARDPKPETEENAVRSEFEKRVAFADARFTQDETRGSLTDRGMVFILIGPPTYSGQRPLNAGDEAGAADTSGQSRFSRTEVVLAQHAGGSTANKQAANERVTGPDSTINRSAANWIESWHYLRAQLPKEIPYQELVPQFVTKDGYGKNVLQREPNILISLERAKRLARGSDATAGKSGSE